MSTQQNPEQEAAEATPVEQDTVPVERTNAYRAGFMAGYVHDNPNADPSVAGYMDGYIVQREGAKEDSE